MSRFQIEERVMRPVQVNEAELMTVTEAAEALKSSVNAVAGMIERGTMRKVVDTDEPNPRRQTRVFRADVEKLKTERRGNRRRSA